MNNKSFRILTKKGLLDEQQNQSIVVNLDQHYNQLDVLSLTLTQEDLYTNKCSDWGVVVGRVTANNGVGVPNAKISIFIPIQVEDESRPEIVSRYPFKQISDQKDGVRYNLLPSVKQSKEHTPVGTFPTKDQILRDDVWIEVYQRYYRFTTRTNDAGDYMFYGVPIGIYTLHFDIDISDIGELSVLPFELIAQGASPEHFANPYKFKSSKDIDNLPQIITKDKTIQVQPFWGSEDLCEVSLLRSDFDLTEQGVELKSYCLFMGSVVSDSGSNSVNKNCGIKNNVGEHGQLVSGPGFINILHVIDSDGDNIPDRVEQKDEPRAMINENGAFVFLLELTGQKVITDEFGNEVISPDASSGIIKNGFYRFKLGLGFESNARIKSTANYIVPNNGKSDYAYLFNRNDVTFYDDTNGLPFDTVPGFNTLSQNNGSAIGWSVDSNNEFDGGELFKKLERKKIYTVRNYIPRYTKRGLFINEKKTEKFIGFKNTASSGDKNPIPYNRINTSINFFTKLLCFFTNIIYVLVAVLNKTIIQGLNVLLSGIQTVLCSIFNSINTVILQPLSGFINFLLHPCMTLPVIGSICLWGDGSNTVNWTISVPFCPPTTNLWGIPYISYSCCKSCPPENNCNCYIPWFTNCYSGSYCDDITPDLRRCKSGKESKCNDIATFQQIKKQNDYPPPPNTTDLDANEIIKQECAYGGSSARNFTTSPTYDGGFNNEFSYNFCVESLKQCKIAENICEDEDPINFEFYNGWLTGVLYFFLIKYKEKRNNDGDIKSLKYCDVDNYNNKSITYPFKNETEKTVIGDREFWLPGSSNWWFDLDVDQSGSGLIKYYPRQIAPALGGGATYNKGAFDDIYYAARSIGRPRGWDNTEYNSPNVLFATDIINLGSYLTEGDPDGAPFMIDLIPSTTFQVPEVLTDFFCLSCSGTQPRTGGEKRFEKICEWGTILNDEQEISTAGEYELEIDEAYHTGRYFILSANTAYNLAGTGIQLMYGNSSGPPFMGGQSVKNFVPYGTVLADAGLLTQDEVYVNSTTYYDPTFLTSSGGEKYIRYQGNPFYFYFGLLPGRSAMDLVKTNFITI